MKQEIIAKPKSYFHLSPNLGDYEKIRRKFDWKDYYNEIEWFPNRKINAAYNAVDRHLGSWRKNKVALYWEGENKSEKYTFEDLAEYSNQFANYLKSFDVKKGQRIFIFLPRIPYLYISFLGILKTGAIAGTLFSAFQEKALFDRLENSGASIIITNTELKKRVDKIRRKLSNLKKIIVVDSPLFQKEINRFPLKFRIAEMRPEDPAFMLYTSGTTGKPKGVVHTHYSILQQHLTAKWVLDVHDEDTYWCTADPGWVTGIAYEILGSWSNGVASVIYEGRFNPDRWYQIIEKYRVTIWYTAPTAIRMLAASGANLPKHYNLSNLRHLTSVGEPLNPDAIRWGLKAFGLPFHDNWWQTETGGICIANYPSMPIKIGSMGKPFPGIIAEIVNDKGEVLPIKKIGNLALLPNWPSMMKTIWRRPAKFKSYFIKNRSFVKYSEKKWYLSGDLAYKDEDGYFWFVGRADDIIKTSGERVGPFEVESALVEHPAVVEAGVIGKPDPMRGEIIKAFVVLASGFKKSEKLKEGLALFVKQHLAGHAYPREIEFIDRLPKTRSGKIVRRLLKAKELGLPVGDTSTLEEY